MDFKETELERLTSEQVKLRLNAAIALELTAPRLVDVATMINCYPNTFLHHRNTNCEVWDLVEAVHVKGSVLDRAQDALKAMAIRRDAHLLIGAALLAAGHHPKTADWLAMEILRPALRATLPRNKSAFAQLIGTSPAAYSTLLNRNPDLVKPSQEITQMDARVRDISEYLSRFKKSKRPFKIGEFLKRCDRTMSSAWLQKHPQIQQQVQQLYYANKAQSLCTS